MWDRTIAGDHDFYVSATATAILFHNCPMIGEGGTQVTSKTLMQNEGFHSETGS
jgi:hypothetical protein